MEVLLISAPHMSVAISSGHVRVGNSHSVGWKAAQAKGVRFVKSSLAGKIAKATARAQKTTEKQLNVDAKDFDKELEAESKAMQ